MKARMGKRWLHNRPALMSTHTNATTNSQTYGKSILNSKKNKKEKPCASIYTCMNAYVR